MDPSVSRRDDDFSADTRPCFLVFDRLPPDDDEPASTRAVCHSPFPSADAADAATRFKLDGFIMRAALLVMASSSALFLAFALNATCFFFGFFFFC